MRVVLLASLLFVACSSGNFTVAPGSGTDASVAPEVEAEASSPDVVVDAPSDLACAETPGVAKFCATVSAVKAHPPYDAASGANELKIDGNGIILVTLYSTDPGIVGELPKRVAQLQFPPASDVGKTVSVDDGMPAIVRGTAPPGTYWFVAMFADNPTPRTEPAAIAGDFVLVPKVEGKKAVYPQVTLENGKTARVDLELRPLRRVDVTLTVGTEITTAAITKKSINGDGPVMFGIYDGDLAASGTNLLSADVVPCIDMKIQKAGGPVSTAFSTTVDGSHRLMAVLFDNLTSGPAFPYKGSLMAPIKPAEAPTVNISTTSWRSTTSAQFTTIPLTSSVTDTDPIHCP